MTNKLKVGIVGASCRQSFVRSFQAIEETDVTAICDLNIDTAEGVANQFNIDQKEIIEWSKKAPVNGC